VCSLFTQKFITFSDQPVSRPAVADAPSLALERNA
jgi:hypothetical protein